jgi:ComF family protein
MGLHHRALQLVFPPQCLQCDGLVLQEGGLCGPCWRDTPFILGLGCDLCGAPLPGVETDHAIHCDDCRDRARPWARGRSVMLYRDGARRLLLALKHGDRLDLAPTLAGWMASRAGPLLTERTLVVPVPAHWWRLFRRRYNQAAVLATGLARRLDQPVCPDLLMRRRRTDTQDGKSPDARFANVDGAFAVAPRHRALLQGRDILLIDDVMTSGATLDACARTCLSGGARQVSVMALARVTRDG